MAAFFLLSLLQPQSPRPIDASLFADRSVTQCFATMLASTRFGATGEETGAFLVAGEDGTPVCHRWQGKGMRRVEWRGTIPAGTIAIVHTHPATAPLPSQHDRDEAKKTQLPFIVVARFQVTAVDTNGGSTILAGAGWTRRSNSPRRRASTSLPNH